MKKRHLISLALLLGCLLLFSGCACKHEWTEADCLNPRLCTKCEETQGDSLGHNFLPATCEAPETCSRCGETQGEPLEHSYGDWTAGEEEMTRACEHCGNTESAEIDREILAAQLLEGVWDYNYVVINNQVDGHSSTMADGIAGTTLFADRDGSCTLYNGERFNDASWKYVKHLTAENGINQYIIGLLLDDYSYTILLGQKDNEISLGLHVDENYYIVLSRNSLLEPAMVGTWSAADNGHYYSVTLNEDRTFTAELEEAVSGHWFLTPVHTSGDSRRSRLILRWETDNGPEGCTFNMDLSNSNLSLEEHIQYHLQFSGQVGSSYLHFGKTSGEDAAAMKDAALSGGQNIVGQWTSTSVITNKYNDGYSSHTSQTTNTTEYSITFAEDGTFTASLDQEYSGTWELRAVQIISSLVNYNYVLTFDEVTDPVYADIFSHSSKLSFTAHNNKDKVSTTVQFRMMDEETKIKQQQAGKNAASVLAGEWRSLFQIIGNQSTNRRIHTDASFLFREDGTFTATLDKTFSGTWKLQSADVREYGTTYYYALYPEGSTEFFDVYINTANGQLECLNYGTDILLFGQLTKEETEAFEKGFDLLPGTWTATESFTYDEETETDVPYKKGNFSMMISADGRYTAQLGEKTEGSWTYYEYSPDQTRYQYMFVSDADQYQMFALHPDGRLECFYWEGDTCVCIYLEKNG